MRSCFLFFFFTKESFDVFPQRFDCNWTEDPAFSFVFLRRVKKSKNWLIITSGRKISGFRTAALDTTSLPVFGSLPVPVFGLLPVFGSLANERRNNVFGRTTVQMSFPKLNRVSMETNSSPFKKDQTALVGIILFTTKEPL